MVLGDGQHNCKEAPGSAARSLLSVPQVARRWLGRRRRDILRLHHDRSAEDRPERAGPRLTQAPGADGDVDPARPAYRRAVDPDVPGDRRRTADIHRNRASAAELNAFVGGEPWVRAQPDLVHIGPGRLLELQ